MSMSVHTPDNPEAAPRPGIYRHYKGGLYEVLLVAKHSETGEAQIVYRALYGERGAWVRPLAMFVEWVERDGVEQPRFAWVEPSETPPR